MARKPTDVESLGHADATRLNIPAAEQQSFVAAEEARPKPVRWPRNTALDPQLVWRGKDGQDDVLTTQSVPIYVQEKIHPEAIIADLRRRSDQGRAATADTPDLFADAYPALNPEDAFDFYEHAGRWQNRMILGDSLLVMTSLVEKEGMRGQVQCIYLDPPYGIKFNSNWQPSTRSRDVKDGKIESLSREPEMIRAFRDTWRDGVHSYLDYLRDRLTVARELLTESGSCFVQIGDENVHLVRALMDEVFGRENFVSLVTVAKTTGAGSPAIGTKTLASVSDFVIWFSKSITMIKYNQIYKERNFGESGSTQYKFIESIEGSFVRSMTSEEIRNPSTIAEGMRIIAHGDLTSQSSADSTRHSIQFDGMNYTPNKGGWKTNKVGTDRLRLANRLLPIGKTLRYKRRFLDFPAIPIHNSWDEFRTSGFGDEKFYVVQTNRGIVERCILMTTDPGDLVLDPTCGSGTTAYVAEQWGRRWITIDTSRVALALARQRLMAGRFDPWLLQDTAEGAMKEGEVSGVPPAADALADLRRPGRKPSVARGFVLHRVPHVTLKSIATNAQIDEIWERHQRTLAPMLDALNAATEMAWEEWEVPREPGQDWPAATRALHADWWAGRRARQAEIDASIARNADTEYLVDKPYAAKGKIRVCGPFTVESLSPHRVLPTDEEADAALLADVTGAEAPARTRSLTRAEAEARAAADFTTVVLDNLRLSGVQNTKKGEKLVFTELKPWSGGGVLAAEGRYQEGEAERRVAIAIGPEYGTVGWQLVREAARAAVELFDTLVICGFAFEPQVNAEAISRLGGLTVLQARMNNDLHMAGALKPNGAGNLFVVFGEPDLAIRKVAGGLVAEIIGLDVFDPTTGAVRSSDLDDIACWFLDDDYDGESFFVRHAYFLGGNDPYERLRNTLKAEIDPEAWDTLYSATSRAFAEPKGGRVAVKVINHYGDEVMKVFQRGRDW